MGIVGRMAAAGAVAGLAVLGGVALTRRQKLWTISHSLKGYALYLSEAPTWAILAEDALLALPCTHNAPEWTFKVGPRRFGVWEDGSDDPIHSLGSLLIGACDMRCMVRDKIGKRVAYVPLTDEQAKEIDPEWVDQINEVMADDEQQKGGDHGDHVGM